MNERIQELACYAWRATSDEVAHLNRMHNRAISHDEQMDVFEQKFAELILKDVVSILESENIMLGGHGYNQYPLHNKIKSHFGVK